MTAETKLQHAVRGHKPENNHNPSTASISCLIYHSLKLLWYNILVPPSTT